MKGSHTMWNLLREARKAQLAAAMAVALSAFAAATPAWGASANIVVTTDPVTGNPVWTIPVAGGAVGVQVGSGYSRMGTGYYPTGVGTGFPDFITVNVLGTINVPASLTTNAAAISLRNNAVINVDGLVQNNAGTNAQGGYGVYSAGPNTVEVNSNSVINVSATGSIISNATHRSSEAINVMGRNNTITVEFGGLVSARSSAAIWFQDMDQTPTVRSNTVINFGTISGNTGAGYAGSAIGQRERRHLLLQLRGRRRERRPERSPAETTSSTSTAARSSREPSTAAAGRIRCSSPATAPTTFSPKRSAISRYW
jgi:hypothetical protein